MFILALAPALALDVPLAVDDMTVIANAEFGSDKVVESAATPFRLRPSTFTVRLQELVDDLDTGGCTDGTTLTYAAGAYVNGFEGSTSSSGTVDGVLNRGTRSMTGTIDGIAYGDQFSTYRSDRTFAANRADGGFVAGIWAKVRGRRGVFMAVQGDCEGPATASEALADWSRLEGWPTCSVLDDPIDGMQVDTGREIGDVASYSCDAGFTLSGDDQRTCTTSGWDGAEPSCGEMTGGGTLTCACDSEYSEGQRVRASQAIHEQIPAGAEGTVLAGGTSSLLVEWDDATVLHNGNCFAAQCGTCDESTGANNRWYVTCDTIEAMP